MDTSDFGDVQEVRQQDILTQKEAGSKENLLFQNT